MKIKCIAIEDEPPALEQIQSYIEKVDFLQLEATFSNAIAPIAYLKENDIDLIFLDIEMEDFTGLQFLEMLPIRPQVILTTAYDKYALNAFDFDVVDYLLKPISFDRFLKAVNKVRTNTPPAQSVKPIHETKPAEAVFIRTSRKVHRVPVEEIRFIEGQKEYLRIHTTKEKLMTLMTFREILDLLPAGFVRIHNSHVVSINHIDLIEDNSVIIGSDILSISNSYRASFFDLLKRNKLIH